MWWQWSCEGFRVRSSSEPNQISRRFSLCPAGNNGAQNCCVISSQKSSNIYTGSWWAFTLISRASGQREFLQPQVVVPVIWGCEHKRNDSRVHRNAWDNLVWQADDPNGNPTKLQALYWVKRQKGYTFKQTVTKQMGYTLVWVEPLKNTIPSKLCFIQQGAHLMKLWINRAIVSCLVKTANIVWSESCIIWINCVTWVEAQKANPSVPILCHGQICRTHTYAARPLAVMVLTS